MINIIKKFPATFGILAAMSSVVVLMFATYCAFKWVLSWAGDNAGLVMFSSTLGFFVLIAFVSDLYDLKKRTKTL